MTLGAEWLFILFVLSFSMRIEGYYSYNRGLEILQKKRPKELQEVIDVISKLKANRFKTKISRRENNERTTSLCSYRTK